MDNLKNMIVLKNLPSNLIDEAFLILKPNQKIKSLEYSPKSNEKEENSREYVIKEAEMVISSFLNKNDITGKKELEMLKKKNKKLRLTSVILSVITIVSIIIEIII